MGYIIFYLLALLVIDIGKYTPFDADFGVFMCITTIIATTVVYVIKSTKTKVHIGRMIFRLLFYFLTSIVILFLPFVILDKSGWGMVGFVFIALPCMIYQLFYIVISLILKKRKERKNG